MKVEVPIETGSRPCVQDSDRQAGGGRHDCWDSTTLVVVEISGGGMTGLGYTYSGASIVELDQG